MRFLDGLIIEVKSNPNICFEPIQKDLVKIQEFITQYKYVVCQDCNRVCQDYCRSIRIEKE